MPKPNFCSTASTSAPTHHEGGVEHIDGRDHAGAAVGAGPDLDGGEHRHDEQAAGDRESGEIERDVQAVARGEIGARCPSGSPQARQPDAVQPRSSANRPISTAPTSVGNSTMRPAASQAARPEPIATDTEKMVRKSVTTSSFAADVVRDERRQQRQDQRADQPEPARHDSAPPQPRVGAHLLEQRAGGHEDVAVDRKIGRARADFRDQQARQPARERGQDHQPGEMDRIAVAVGGDAGDDRADQNGEKGAAFDQRIARRQFLARQQIRQDAVFDRAEQRGERAEQNTARNSKAQRVEGKARDADQAAPISTSLTRCATKDLS